MEASAYPNPLSPTFSETKKKGFLDFIEHILKTLPFTHFSFLKDFPLHLNRSHFVSVNNCHNCLNPSKLMTDYNSIYQIPGNKSKHYCFYIIVIYPRNPSNAKQVFSCPFTLCSLFALLLLFCNI